MEIIDYLAGLYHAINDFFTFIGWLFSNLVGFLHNLFLPVNYVFQFLKGITQNAFSPAITPPALWAFPDGVMAVFNAIPYWADIKNVFILALGVVFLIFILKDLKSI
jgi:hypothetical protein